VRGVLDGLAAEADRRDESCGDEQRAFHSVVGVQGLGHEAKILPSSLFIRLANLVGKEKPAAGAAGLGLRCYEAPRWVHA
jgi:hypothetical protein